MVITFRLCLHLSFCELILERKIKIVSYSITQPNVYSYIPEECIPTAAVATTRSQYLGRDGLRTRGFYLLGGVHTREVVCLLRGGCLLGRGVSIQRGDPPPVDR